MKDIYTLADDLGLHQKEYHPFGHFCGKIDLSVLNNRKPRANHKVVLVTATNPTPMGEGKTVTTIGLSSALNLIGQKSIGTLRQSSMGPLFGIKGGGGGGGLARILPEEDNLLHLTGDIHAISQAHNQLAAIMDNQLYFENTLEIDKDTIHFPRTIDINDRFLRDVDIGVTLKKGEVAYRSHFIITPASELMAILSLAQGNYEDEIIKDMRERLGKIVVAKSKSGKPICVSDLRGEGAALVILKKAMMPNLLQSSDHTPLFIHGGPFANIAHGCNSVIADQTASRLCDYVVTEAGFGSDLGFEKFVNIKSRQSGMYPDAVVLVTTLRSLKFHSGAYSEYSPEVLGDRLGRENMQHLEMGLDNLRHHIESINSYGVPVVVAINNFTSDTAGELEFVEKQALGFGASRVQLSRAFAEGAKGAQDLALAVHEVCEASLNMTSKTKTFAYQLEDSIENKILALARRHYNTESINYSEHALSDLEELSKLELKVPICMAKTPRSISHDPKLLGRPSDYEFYIDSLEYKAGAGFIVVMAGKIFTMPGLNRTPIAQWVSLNNSGKVLGLF